MIYKIVRCLETVLCQQFEVNDNILYKPVRQQ